MSGVCFDAEVGRVDGVMQGEQIAERMRRFSPLNRRFIRMGRQIDHRDIERHKARGQLPDH